MGLEQLFETRDAEIISSITLQSKHIELSFRRINEDGMYQGFPGGEQWEELKALFFTCHAFEIEVGIPFLLVRVPTLPPKPWPLSVAGMPLKFTTHETSSCFKFGENGRTRGDPFPHTNLRHTPFEAQRLDDVIDYLLDQEINVKRVVWFGLWRIIVSDDTDLATLLCIIFGVITRYHFASEFPQPNLSAVPVIKPAGTVYDDTRYDLGGNRLRPGVMISSSVFERTDNGQTLESWSSATAGVLVQDSGTGAKFMTIPTHVLQNSYNRDVYHPDPKNGVIIGTAVYDLDKTDITLVKLNDDITFENVTFETEIQDATQITGIRDHREFRQSDPIWMNNPYTGLCDGQHLGLAGRIEGYPEDTRRYRENYLMFENHVTTEPIAGCCGSAIVHEDGQLVGFYHFLDDEGFSIAVSAEELTKRGFTIPT